MQFSSTWFTRRYSEGEKQSTERRSSFVSCSLFFSKFQSLRVQNKKCCRLRLPFICCYSIKIWSFLLIFYEAMTEFSRCNEFWIKAFVLLLWLYVKWGLIFFSPCNILLFCALWFLILTFCAEGGSVIPPCCSDPILLAWNTRPKKTGSNAEMSAPLNTCDSAIQRCCHVGIWLPEKQQWWVPPNDGTW